MSIISFSSRQLILIDSDNIVQYFFDTRDHQFITSVVLIIVVITTL